MIPLIPHCLRGSIRHSHQIGDKLNHVARMAGGFPITLSLVLEKWLADIHFSACSELSIQELAPA